MEAMNPVPVIQNSLASSALLSTSCHREVNIQVFKAEEKLEKIKAYISERCTVKVMIDLME